LHLGETRQPIGADAAQFAVEIGGLRPHGRKRRRHARISGRPIEASAREELCLAALDACRHAIAVQLYFMHPL
jgi:hypothetical protein